MPADERPREEVEERSALEELERLHRAIEQSRQKRREANDAFDSFLQSFGTRSGREGPSASAPANVRAQPRTSEPPALPPSGPPPAPAAPPPRRDATHAAVVGEPRAAEPAGASEPGASPGDASRQEPVVPAALIAEPAPAPKKVPWVLAAVAIIVVAAIAWRAYAPGGPRETATPVPEPVVGLRPQAAPAGKPAAAPPPAPVTELATARPVWVRVTVDGERVLERELEAGVRIPLKATERIVIRAGDAGAIRLTIAGKDQGVFGPDGIAVTRTFAVPPASPR
jgi:hypothetical protein